MDHWPIWFLLGLFTLVIRLFNRVSEPPASLELLKFLPSLSREELEALPNGEHATFTYASDIAQEAIALVHPRKLSDKIGFLMGVVVHPGGVRHICCEAVLDSGSSEKPPNEELLRAIEANAANLVPPEVDRPLFFVLELGVRSSAPAKFPRVPRAWMDEVQVKDGNVVVSLPKQLLGAIQPDRELLPSTLHMTQTTFLQPDEQLVARGLEVKAMTTYTIALEAEARAVLEQHPLPPASCLQIMVGVKPGGRARCWSDPAGGELPVTLLRELDRRLPAVPPITVSGPIVFALGFTPKARKLAPLPVVVPRAWREVMGHQAVFAKANVPDGLFAVLWPDRVD